MPVWLQVVFWIWLVGFLYLYLPIVTKLDTINFKYNDKPVRKHSTKLLMAFSMSAIWPLLLISGGIARK